MLPMMILQPSDLATFDTALNSANLLPQEAAEPIAEFADILRLGVESDAPSDLALGITLPQAGNELPPPALPGIDAIASNAAGSSPLAHPGADHIEPMPFTPASVPAGEQIVRDAFASGAAPWTGPNAMPSGAPLTQPPTLAGVAQGQIDVAALTQDGRVLREGRPVESAALTPVLPPGPAPETSISQIARELATAPAAVANAAAIVDEANPGRRKQVPIEALSMPGRTPESATRSAASQTPAVAAIRDELPTDIRPLPAAPSAVQSVQPQLTVSGAIEIPTGQQGQTGPVQLAPLQMQATAATAAPATQLTQSIAVPVRDQVWGERIGERVLLMASNRLQSAEIRLTPAELGPLRIQVAVDDGAANVTFLAQHAVTRDAIEQALPRLRELLAENGLTLNQTSVGGQGEQGVLEGNPDNTDDDAGLAQSARDEAGDSIVEDAAGTPRAAPRPDSLVDTFV